MSIQWNLYEKSGVKLKNKYIMLVFSMLRMWIKHYLFTEADYEFYDQLSIFVHVAGSYGVLKSFSSVNILFQLFWTQLNEFLIKINCQKFH